MLLFNDTKLESGQMWRMRPEQVVCIFIRGIDHYHNYVVFSTSEDALLHELSYDTFVKMLEINSAKIA